MEISLFVLIFDWFSAAGLTEYTYIALEYKFICIQHGTGMKYLACLEFCFLILSLIHTNIFYIPRPCMYILYLHIISERFFYSITILSNPTNECEVLRKYMMKKNSIDRYIYIYPRFENYDNF